MQAWNGWYHVSSSTYGTWLRGDPRGWRSRRHREHVEGDYRNPPPEGRHEFLYEQSKRLLKKPPVRLTNDQRRIAVEAIAEKLKQLQRQPLAVSVDTVHYHILGRFLNGRVRAAVGRAKKHAWHLLVEQGFSGRAWAKACHPLPISDRQHQLRVYGYIRRHVEKGAYVWTFRDGIVGPES